jgi:hypothetical protein
MHVDGNNKRKLLIVAFLHETILLFSPTHLQQNSFINCFNAEKSDFFVVIKIHELMSDMYHVEKTARDVSRILMCGVCDDG